MKIVSVEFKKGGKQYLFNGNNLELRDEECVIVETEKGEQFGTVKSIKILEGENNHSPVLRIATKDDIKKNELNEEDAAKAVIKAQEISLSLELDMKFINAYYTFDRRQLVFNFIADARVDFRELAKSLANIYKTRIELRQVGIRDKAKEISGLGACGRKLCCSSFLQDLDSVGISMVKNQNLSLNPTKINGLCGRLLCCLKYEDELYSTNKKDMPVVGEEVTYNGEKATVTFVNIPSRKFKVITETGERGEITLKEESNKNEKRDKRSSKL